MNKSTIFRLVFLTLLVGGIIVGGQFLVQNLGSVKGLLRAPPQDVAETLSRDNQIFALPDGFSMSIFANDLDGARVLHLGPSGEILVSLTKLGKVVAILDTDANGVADNIIPVLSGLNNPHGVAHRCFLDELGVEEMCELYVAQEDKVVAYMYDKGAFAAEYVRILIELPQGDGHYTRTLLPHPDGKRLLVSVGSSCNVCTEGDKRRATILSVPYDGSEYAQFAIGLRNSVFLTSHPVTGEIWATEMGRDWLGDDTPPDEINIIEEGSNYGWPICYGKNIHDTDFDKNTYIRAPCQQPFEKPSYIDIPAHSAPLGLSFILEEGWPEDMRNDLLVAYHGSWNSSTPVGYKIVKFNLSDSGEFLGVDDFILGWLVGDNEDGVLGRPVDILTLPGGIAYISDDRAGVVYRLVYSGDGE
jgi:glucose/arabinose dehydrogenase